jgi:hypothetical protein
VDGKVAEKQECKKQKYMGKWRKWKELKDLSECKCKFSRFKLKVLGIHNGNSFENFKL